MNKVLITGSSGMVGYAVCREAVDKKLKVTGLGRHDRHQIPGMKFVHVNLMDTDAVTATLEENEPDLVVHLAANTNHDACERDPETTRNLHVHVSEHLARISLHLGARFVHASTEAVYGNLGQGCRLETDVCHPEGIYAVTKKEAEERVLHAHPDALILRITPVGFAPNGARRTLAEWLLDQFEQGSDITGFDNVFFTPISSYSLARLILDPRVADIHGVHNWGIDEILTKYDFALRLAAALDLGKVRILPGRRTPSSNTYHGGMDSTLLSKALGIPPPSSVELFADLARNVPLQ